MPIYEFECAGCGHRYDRLQKLSDEDPTICPVCGAPLLHRRVSAPSFRLAGSGWYETDFKKDGDKKRNLAESKSDSGSSSSSSDSTASKPDSSEKTAAPSASATPSPAAAPAAPPSGASGGGKE